MQKILCILSPLNPNKANLENYTTRDNGIVKGRQTNEAPVKALLQLAWQSKPQEEKEIIYLVSDRVKNQKVSYPLPGEKSSGVEEQTAESYFCEAIKDFCRQSGKDCPKLTSIEYNKQVLEEKALREAFPQFLDKLSNKDTLYIDMTGGGRDGATLLMLAVQVLGYKNLRFGSMVYSSLDEKTIAGQENVRSLIDMIKAMEVFTRYGNAQPLSDYFEHTENQEIRTLCHNLKSFSDALNVCRTDKMDEYICKIHDSFRKLEKNPATQLDVSEQLFCKLIPNMRSEFVQEDSDVSKMMLELIRWCAKRKLTMPALALYRENMADVIAGLRLVVPSEQLLQYLESCKHNKEENENGPRINAWQNTCSYALGLMRRGIRVYNDCGKNMPVDFEGKSRIGDFWINSKGWEKNLQAPFWGVGDFSVFISSENLKFILAADYVINMLRNNIMHAGDNNGLIQDAAEYAGVHGDFQNMNPEKICKHIENFVTRIENMKPMEIPLQPRKTGQKEPRSKSSW